MLRQYGCRKCGESVMSNGVPTGWGLNVDDPYYLCPPCFKRHITMEIRRSEARILWLREQLTKALERDPRRKAATEDF